MKKTILLIVSLVILLSCKNEERVIDNVKETWSMLVATAGQTPGLLLYDMPDGTLKNDVYLANNSKNLAAPVEKIATFRGNLYLFMPSIFKIEVISKSTYKHVATIDFSSSGKEPTDICFPNATDAYICHGNDSTVSLVDITDSSKFIIARTITVGKNPVAIVSSGNQIFVANQTDNTVSLIDSRYHTVSAVIPVATAPTYLDVNADGKKVVVISLGSGKQPATGSKSAATASIIDVLTHTIITTQELTTSTINAIDLVPTGFAISNYDLAFVSAQQCLLTYDVQAGQSVNLIDESGYIKMTFSPLRDEFILLKNENGSYTAKVLDANFYGQNAEIIFNVIVNCAFAL